MEEEEVKKILCKLLGEDDLERGRKFSFSDNFDSAYKVFAGITLSDLLKFIIPSILMAVFIAVLPPYKIVLFWFIKLIVIVVIITFGFLIAMLKPVKYRKNIKCMDYIRTRIAFAKRQKLYFLNPNRNEQK